MTEFLKDLFKGLWAYLFPPGERLSVPGAQTRIMAAPPAPQAPALTDRATAQKAIWTELVGPVRLKDGTVWSLPQVSGAAILSQAEVETGNFKAKYLPITRSWSNRHKGSGRGEWTGHVHYVSPRDPDIRIYTDFYQCARDFRQLLSDPLYRPALDALRLGLPMRYFDELQRAGYSAEKSYSLALSSRFTGSGYA